jgi:hypothetical protein
MCLTSCSGGGALPAPDGKSRDPSASAAATADTSPPSTPPAADGAPTFRGLFDVTTNESIGPVTVDGDSIVAPMSVSRDGRWSVVGLADASNPGLRDVAQTEFDHGFINWATKSGDWIGWVDQSAEQSDQSPNVLWRVHVLNLLTADTEVIDSNGQFADPFVPRIKAQGGLFFWTRAESDGSARERLWTPSTSRVTDIFRHREMTPTSETLAGAQLVYLGPASTPHTGHTVGGDCWAQPLAGGDPVALTHTALALGCTASGDHLVWTRHIDAEHDPVPQDGVLENPYQVLVQPLAEGEPTVLHTGYLAMGYPTASQNFTVWPLGTRRPVVTKLSDQTQLNFPKLTYGYQLTLTDDDRLAVSIQQGTSTLLRVGQLAP